MPGIWKKLSWAMLGCVLAVGCRDRSPASPPVAPTAASEPKPGAKLGAEAEELALGASDADAYFAVIEPHMQRVSIYAPPTKFLDEFAKTPPKVQHLLAAHWCASEISNGGFHQLFSSSAGVLVPEAVAGLRAMGLTENAVIVEQAASVFGQPYPREKSQRHKKIDALKRKSKGAVPFTELDERFFSELKRRPGGFDAVAASFARGAP